MTTNELVDEVKRQMAEYDLPESEALANVADDLGRKWSDVADEFYAALGVRF